jgi:zinc protease
MAFNGTKNFKKHELVDYVESIGMRFGADLNAYTSFDETVYMLTVPTDSLPIVEKGFDILEDWAHLVSFDDDEIDKERGVVIEEWRLGRGAEARMFDKQFPILFKNSRYAERLPIGKKDILESFKHDTLRRFYKDWYRPELTAVIAVGDFDKAMIEKLIRKHFSAIPASSGKRPRTLFPVPDNTEPLFAIATDPEATISRVSVYYKHEVESESLLVDYRRSIVEGLYNNMFNDRLTELSKLADPPFLYAYSSSGRFVRTKSFYSLAAVVKDNGIERALESLLTEAARVRKYGFTSTELDRQKKDFLRSYENAYNEREKTESGNFASEYIRHFLTDEPIPGIVYEYDVVRSLLPGITIQEVNAIGSKWITDKNRVVLTDTPEKKGVGVPSTDTLMHVFAAASKVQVQPYLDKVSDRKLVETLPSPATIVSRNERKELGLTEWKLSNGARVILKPTDFKNDEILFTAFSPGGTSLVPDKDFIPASTSSTVIREGGVGSFDEITLQKLLAGKIVNVSPYVSELEEGLSGSASPADIETMFQLIYLYSSSPRMDSSAFTSFQSRIRGFLQNRSARPESAFEDTLQVTLAQHHQRRQPISEAMLDRMNLQTSFKIYKDRFADVSDFTFIFVGSFKLSDIEPLVCTYIGGLPGLNRNEKWKNIGVTPPKGVIDKVVRKGLEPKSQVRIVFTGPFTWTPDNRYQMGSLASVLRIKFREALREEKGGTYGVSVSGSPWQYPLPEYRFTISFGCAPDRVEELTKAAFEQIDSLGTYGIGSTVIAKVKETQRRERETDLKQNGFWLSTLQFYYDNNDDPGRVLKYDEFVEKLSSPMIQNAARQYLNMKNYVKVTLVPEATQ